jgi:alkanesulfonate monooxygenase
MRITQSTYEKTSREPRLPGGTSGRSPQGERLDKRLWTGVARVTGAGGNTTSLVGTPEQVADALLDYYDLGVTTFLMRGFDPLDDAIQYGQELIPLVREAVKNRPARSAAA